MQALDSSRVRHSFRSCVTAPSLVGLALLGTVLAATQTAGAQPFNLQIITCEGIFKGDWDQARNTCTVQDFELDAADTLNVTSAQTLVVQGESSNAGGITSNGTLQIEGVFDNTGSIVSTGGSIDLGAGSEVANSWLIELQSPARLNNEGAFENDGTITIQVGATFNNSGAGTFDNLTGGNLHNYGSVNNQSSLINFGTVLNSGDATLSNQSGASLANSGTLYNTAGGAATNMGSFELDESGALLLQDGAALFMNLGTMTSIGTVNNTEGSTFNNPGTFTIDSPTAVLLNSGGSITNSGVLTSEGDITNSDSANFANLSTFDLGVTSAGALSPALLNNGSTASFTNTGRTRVFGQIINSGFIVNNASATFISLGIDNVAGTVNNYGPMAVLFGVANHNDFLNTGTLSAGTFLNFCSALLDNAGTVNAPLVNFQGTVVGAGTITAQTESPDCRQ